MGDVTIRMAEQTDAGSLAFVAAVTFPLACPPHTTREAAAAFVIENLGPDAFARYLADPNRVLLIAADDGTAIGYTMVVVAQPSDPDVAAVVTLSPTSELSKCYVLPGYHGQGVSRSLMEASIDAARARGAAGMWLGVNEENVRAQRFYAKSGFERVGSKRFRVGENWEDDYVFERALAEARDD